MMNLFCNDLCMRVMAGMPGGPASGGGAAGAPAPGPLALLGPMTPFILIFLIFYFLIIAPQRKQQKETEKMLKALKRGDRVVTSGGLHGIITDIKEAEKIVVIQVAPNVRVDVSRSAVTGVTREAAPAPGAKPPQP